MLRHTCLFGNAHPPHFFIGIFLSDLIGFEAAKLFPSGLAGKVCKIFAKKQNFLASGFEKTISTR
jgi:hypothetical protein